MHHVILERWSQGASPLHLRDARAKILVLVTFLIVMATTPQNAWARLAAYAAIMLVSIWVARLPFLGLLGRAAIVLPFSVTFGLISWFGGDHSRAIALVAKTYISTAAVLLIAGVTALAALLRGAESLGAPRVLVSVVQFLYRYLFVISEQAQHMRLAGVSRGGLRKNQRRARFDAAAGAIGVLFARSYYRADGIHRAMLARGYNGRLPTADPGRFTKADAAFAGLAITVLISVRLLPY